jgi:hypothetical protein
MRRIDVIGIGLGLFLAGGVTYGLFRSFGLDPANAGIWSQVLLVAGVLVWLSTYLLRVFTRNMTYYQQLDDYKEAVLQKRLESLTPEELAQIQAEIKAESQSDPPQ